jgi:hypothetical protein
MLVIPLHNSIHHYLSYSLHPLDLFLMEFDDCQGHYVNQLETTTDHTGKGATSSDQ